jgi:hypothetical protein
MVNMNFMALSKTYFSSYIVTANTEFFDICQNARFSTDTAGFNAGQKIFVGYIVNGFFVACTNVQSSSDLEGFVTDIQNSILQADNEFIIDKISLAAEVVETNTIVKNLAATLLSREADAAKYSIVQAVSFALVFEDSGSETLLLQTSPVEIRTNSSWLAPATTLAAQQGRSLLQL